MELEQLLVVSQATPSLPITSFTNPTLVEDTTPRDGATRNPFQQDSTRFRNAAADACGETLGGGTNDPATQVPAMLAANGGQMPQISAGGMVMMTLHQVNGDGAGPYECMIDSTGAGTQCKLPLHNVHDYHKNAY